jgi:hypothetical protein
MTATTTTFDLGALVMTRGVAREFTDPTPLLAIIGRHMRGDWGEVGAADARANDDALREGARLLSAYTVDGRRLWIITEADRSATTILFPEEY